MRFFGYVIIKEQDYDALQTLERGYRNLMWKFHHALVDISNGPYDPGPGDAAQELQNVRDSAKDMLGMDLSFERVEKGQ